MRGVTLDWCEKIRRYRETYAVAFTDMETAAGWKGNSLSSKLSTASMPGSGLGTRLATSLGVPAAWLFDESMEWPPPVDEEVILLAVGRIGKTVASAAASGAAERHHAESPSPATVRKSGRTRRRTG